MKRYTCALLIAGLAACGGPPQVSPRNGPPTRIQQGGEGPKKPDSKGTWIVDPSTPPHADWAVARASGAYSPPVQTGDTLKVDCPECASTMQWMTAWTLKDGAYFRTIHLDLEVDPFAKVTLPLQSGDENLRVIWSDTKLLGIPTDFVNLTEFAQGRVSPIRSGPTGPSFGVMEWGPIDETTTARRVDIGEPRLARR